MEPDVRHPVPSGWLKARLLALGLAAKPEGPAGEAGAPRQRPAVVPRKELKELAKRGIVGWLVNWVGWWMVAIWVPGHRSALGVLAG